MLATLPAEQRAVAVGLGELRVTRDPQEVLVAYGLGSCVAIGFYDPFAKTASLLHAVLPCHLNGEDQFSTKYVDSGLAMMLRALNLKPAEHTRLKVWLVGGANMLASAPGLARSLDIGKRNIAAAQDTLRQLGLKICAEAVGGHTGRTARLYVAEGRFTMRKIGDPERDLSPSNESEKPR